MKLIWDKSRKKWVEASKYVPPSRVHLISDFESPIESPITGEAIHSKAQYQHHLKHLGRHIAEPGDVAKRPGVDRQQIRADIKATLQQMKVVG